MTHSLSIIIPNYNGVNYIGKCLGELQRSIAKTSISVEVVVVDDCSNDASVAYIESQFPWVIVVPLKQNRGFAGACHAGAQYAHGSLLLFLNNDAWPSSDAIAQIGELAHRPHADAAAFTIRNPDGSYQGGPCGLDWLGFPGDGRKPTKLFFALGAAFLVRQETYFKIGGFDTDYGAYSEEVDLCWRLHLFQCHLEYFPDIVFYHTGGASYGKSWDKHGRSYRRLYLTRKNTLKTLLKNYSTLVLPVAVAMWLCETTAEVIGSLVILQPQVARADLSAIIDVIRDRTGWYPKRRNIQMHRTVSDWFILRRMLPPFEKTRFAARLLYKRTMGLNKVN